MTIRIFAVASLAAILLTGGVFPVAAQAASAAPSVTVRVNPAPATPAQARAQRRRLEAAALEVCGASQTSLWELRLAVRDSACYRKALDGALAQIGNPAFASR